MAIASSAAGASFSCCRRWRYLLWRRWDAARPVANFLMLNPSTADEFKLDPSCTRARLYAERWGYGALIVTNLFAWRGGLAKDYAFPAEPVVRAGAHYAALDFNNVTELGGDLLPMAEQVRRGIAWVCANAERLGADPRRVYVCGTSSGAHLSGVAATTDWTRYGLPPDPVRGYTLVSGMYDLRGPRLSKRSAYVKFTDAMEDALSPQRHIERISAPIVLVYGSLETPEFQRQSRDFADALTRAGKSCEIIRAEGYNHFEIAETLGNPYGPAGRALLAQMKLNSGSGA